MEGTEAGGLIQANGAGEYGVEFTGNLGNATKTHLVQVWRLPAGATLLEKISGMQESTNNGQIELRMDKIIAAARQLSHRLSLPTTSPVSGSWSGGLKIENSLSDSAAGAHIIDE